MKRLSPTSIALLAFAIPAHAQITVTNSVFPVIGDTLFYAFGNQPNAAAAIYTPPGGSQAWDLSALQADSLWQQIFRDPATGVGAADHPGADLMYTPAGALAGQEDYLNVTATEVAYMGSHGVDPIQIGSSWTTHWLPAQPTNWAPLNFFDIRQATSSMMTYFLPSEMPPGTVDQLGGQVDSMRFRSTFNVLEVVDAWGSLTIPGGTYPVLREKRTRYTGRRLDVHTQLGWLDATDMAISDWGMVDVFGVDTVPSFHFINDLSKETIAICTMNGALNTVTGVQYKVADFSTGTGSASATAPQVRVFPNPSTDRIRIQAPDVQPGMYDVIVLDALGRQVMRRRGEAGSNNLQLDLDITGLETGIYRGAILLDDGGRSVFRFVKQ